MLWISQNIMAGWMGVSGPWRLILLQMYKTDWKRVCKNQKTRTGRNKTLECPGILACSLSFSHLVLKKMQKSLCFLQLILCIILFNYLCSLSDKWAGSKEQRRERTVEAAEGEMACILFFTLYSKTFEKQCQDNGSQSGLFGAGCVFYIINNWVCYVST